MKSVIDTEGMSFEDYVMQKADTWEQFRNRYEIEKKTGNELFATMYKDSIEEMEKDLKRMSHEGRCVWDYVSEELKRRKISQQENEVENENSLDNEQIENELI